MTGIKHGKDKLRLVLAQRAAIAELRDTLKYAQANINVCLRADNFALARAGLISVERTIGAALKKSE